MRATVVVVFTKIVDIQPEEGCNAITVFRETVEEAPIEFCDMHTASANVIVLPHG
jgi:hypothetical protein